MKERRKGLLWEMALILLTVAACLYSTGAGNIFGAKVDWSSQHSVFPEYFRQQFYRTGQFFPEFALNIGGGQNIYNFSYYGLFSPVVLIGYLLPNVKMSDYMMVASIVCLAAAVIILYRWLKSPGIYSCGKRDDSADVSFRRTYDLSVVASDYVCKLYAISLSDIFGNRPIF